MEIAAADIGGTYARFALAQMKDGNVVGPTAAFAGEFAHDH
ncbi:MAG: hypothetical protein ACLQUZ_03855 [Rhizomicrobium sp.]